MACCHNYRCPTSEPPFDHPQGGMPFIGNSTGHDLGLGTAPWPPPQEFIDEMRAKYPAPCDVSGNFERDDP